jgi:hypothetical protein
MKMFGGNGYIDPHILALDLDIEQSALCPGCFTSKEEPPISMDRRLGGCLGQSRRQGEKKNLTLP